MMTEAGRPPAYQALADELRADITSGRLRPGQRLPAEPELCARAGVSRSTVREALRLLASQHLVVTTRGVTGGSFVAQPDAGKLSDSLAVGMTMLRSAAMVGLADLVEVREVLEAPIAELAAARRTEDDLVALREALFDPADAGVEEMVRAHAEFHGALAAATGNPLFELVTRPLYQLLNGDELGDAAPASYWRQIDADHRELLAKVEAGDGPGAAEVSRRHLRYVGENMPC
ncbi:FadR/GntR family transcriptional regulator [Spirilliplanes yamanashiensis]|uniref:GntR family transcriptional regulator n=1 Tax=Spirilliplanes yamanashiensis TaxID=42233 RepID=A0A8J3Y3X6_9ACTN|nr:FadR/GntR family transcriptional regulator [Spirilliplanes yamanashiensis]MDP9820108.1 DNA-binding FadR family transcriptional regulator [Spirilliplanes yamanashiensis]GIJ01072.1 GntR family transcriptional regulator [Spirilliplanes yamanashiensis]